MIIQNPILTGSVALNGLNLTATNLATTSSNSFTSDQSITGSLGISANTTIAGTLTVTGSIVGLATSASYVLNAVSSSKAVSASYSDTASFSNNFTVMGNLTVFGTQSVQYITSSQLNVANNVITVNVGTPGVRFGGLSVYDSGSTAGATGSLFWDSFNNNWVYQQVTGSTYTGGMLISGPRNFAGLGNEQGTTSGSLMKGQGGDHMTSSAIFEDGYKATVYTNALVVSSSGLVGIGTTTPSASLHIVSGNEVIRMDTTSTIYDSSIRFYNNNSSTYWGGIQAGPNVLSTGGMYIYSQGAYPLAFYTNGSERMRITNSGSIGIGTTNPSTILQVIGAAQFGDATSMSSFTAAPIKIRTTSTSSIAFTYSSVRTWEQGISSLGSFIISDTDSNNSVRLSISSSGYVGINNTTPSDRLDVAGTIRATVNTSYFTTFGYTGGTLIRMVSPVGETADNMVFKIDGASSSTAGNQFIFQTQAGNTTPVTTLWINKLGDVNIGTTTSTKYQVLNLTNDANTAGAAIGLARSAGQFITNAGAGDFIIGNATGKNILFGNTGAGTTEYARITSNGKLIVSSAAEKTATTIRVEAYNSTNQHVYWGYVDNGSGNAVWYGRIDATANVWNYFQYGASIVGSISFNGTNTLYNATSDYRIKSDFENFTALDVISNLQPKKFRVHNSTNKMAGFIAHELQPYIPQAVTGEKDAIDEDGNPIYQQVDVSQIVPFLTKAIQELKAEIDELKNK